MARTPSIGVPPRDTGAIAQRGAEKNRANLPAIFEARPRSKNLGFSPVAKVIPPVVTLFTGQDIAINLPFTEMACRVKTGVKMSCLFIAFVYQ